MEKDNNLFKKIILWAYKRQEEGFFWVELQETFSLNQNQNEWAIKILRPNMPISENLIDHLRYDETTNADKFFITAKGVAIARSYMDVKNWYEKPMGQIAIGLIIAVVGAYIAFKAGWM